MIVTIQCKRISCLFDTNTNNVFKTKLPLFKLDKCKFMKMTVPNDNANSNDDESKICIEVATSMPQKNYVFVPFSHSSLK